VGFHISLKSMQVHCLLDVDAAVIPAGPIPWRN
jgi:hypothetical protein